MPISEDRKNEIGYMYLIYIVCERLGKDFFLEDVASNPLKKAVDEVKTLLNVEEREAMDFINSLHSDVINFHKEISLKSDEKTQ